MSTIELSHREWRVARVALGARAAASGAELMHRIVITTARDAIESSAVVVR